MNDISELLASGAIVVDVRTPGEYAEGHFDGSINIPLNEIPGRLDELKKDKEIVVCCASGIRSSNAMAILSRNGIVCHDGGSWLNLKDLITDKPQSCSIR